MNKKIALCILSHDGITGYYAGVGTYTQCYIDNLTALHNEAKHKGYDIKPYLITQYTVPIFYGWNPRTRAKSEILCRELGGEIIEIDSGLAGVDVYGGIENWERASQMAAKHISSILAHNDEVIIVAIDTTFLAITGYLNEFIKKEDWSKIRISLSPQSTELVHKSGTENRFKWERKHFLACLRFDNVYVSYSSYFMRDNLERGYGIPSDRLIPSLSGLSFGSDRLRKRSSEELSDELTARGIPIDRNIVMTVGRLEAYKGFDQTIELFRTIAPMHRPFLIMTGVSYVPNNPLIVDLYAKKERYGIDGKFFFDLDLDLSPILWQWQNTRISCHLSEREPFGLAPLEARCLAVEKGPVVVVSDRDGLKEQFEDGKEGFVVKYGSFEDYKSVTRTVFDDPSFDVQGMRHAAYDNVIEKYDSSKNIRELLSYLSPALMK